MERLPITRASLLDKLDDHELLEGYIDGRDNSPEPGNNRTFSYWHGWRNGMVDGKHSPIDDAGRELARDVIKTGYLKEQK